MNCPHGVPFPTSCRACGYGGPDAVDPAPRPQPLPAALVGARYGLTADQITECTNAAASVMLELLDPSACAVHAVGHRLANAGAYGWPESGVDAAGLVAHIAVRVARWDGARELLLELATEFGAGAVDRDLVARAYQVRP